MYRVGYPRLTRIISGPIADMLGDIFKKEYEAHYTSKWDKSKGARLLTKLQRKGMNFFPNQEDCIKDGDVNNWDVSLVSRILLHHDKGQNIWKLDPVQESAIKTLRDIRNKIAHSRTSLSVDEITEKIFKAVGDLLSGDKEGRDKVINAVKKIQQGISLLKLAFTQSKNHLLY